MSLTIWYMMSSLLIAPHYLSYFNELAGGSHNGNKYLLDSNLDWGQDLKGLSLYIKEKKIENLKVFYWGNDSCAYRKIKCQRKTCNPEPGLFAVSVNHLMGLTKRSQQCLKWLLKHNPIDKIGYSIFIYNISPEQIYKKS